MMSSIHYVGCLICCASSDDKLNLSEYGIEVKNRFKDLTNVELKDLINESFLNLCCSF